MTFQDRARGVVRDFVRTVVLLDDEWPDAMSSLSVDPLPADEIDEKAGVGLDDADSYLVTAKVNSPPKLDTRLREVETAFVAQGVAFTGLRYDLSKRDVARRLSQRAEVLILDWNLVGNDDGGEVIDLLKDLRDQSSGPRFVVIYTGQGKSEEVQKRLGEALERQVEAREGTADFKVGSFVFSVRSKPSRVVGSEFTSYKDLADNAIAALAKEYGGLLDLCILELTARHQAQLGTMLSRFGRDLDIALLCEWADQDSPIHGEGESLRELLLDEWAAGLRSGAGQAYRVMSKEGFHAFLGQCKRLVPAREPEEEEKTYREKVKEGLAPMRSHLKSGKDGPQDQLDKFIRDKRVMEAGADYEKFLQGPHERWLPFRIQQPVSEVERHHAHWTQGILKAKLGVGDIDTPMKRLQCVFSQQSRRPRKLTQGTILRTEQDYFLCITPLCDAARPDKVGHTFLFVKASPNSGKGSLEEGTRVVVEDRSASSSGRGSVLELLVNPNPPIALVIQNSSLESEGTVLPALSATSWGLGGSEAVQLEFVAQLRTDRALLVATAALKALQRIGVDNVEHLRRK